MCIVEKAKAKSPFSVIMDDYLTSTKHSILNYLQKDIHLGYRAEITIAQQSEYNTYLFEPEMLFISLSLFD